MALGYPDTGTFSGGRKAHSELPGLVPFPTPPNAQGPQKIRFIPLSVDKDSVEYAFLPRSLHFRGNIIQVPAGPKGLGPAEVCVCVCVRPSVRSS